MASGWHENAVIYALEIGTYQDSNGDGRGDIQGLIDRLPYLAELGVTCLWVLPFYPSPNADNGYDIIDYLDTDPEVGSIAEFERFVRAAHDRGIRVLIDLVAHHTSVEHPWFQAARSDPESRYRDYYVWSAERPEGDQAESIFPGVEEGVWKFDDSAGAHYHHRFYHFQPDLNFANPDVRREILHVADFWMHCGIDGFRIDALNHLFEQKGTPGTSVENPCAFLGHLRNVISRHNADAVLLAEADIEPGDFQKFHCDGSGIDLFMNFLINNYLFLALARQSAAPLIDGMQQLANTSVTWLNYCRNLDELDLERLSQDEQNDVYAAFAPDAEMRLYNRGIRRRLAPMLGRDSDLHRLALSVTFALPGATLLAYGDEIGMGDDLERPERNSVRSPMQWSDAENAGFSTAAGNPNVPPAITAGDFRYGLVNVTKQQGQDHSLLHFVQGLIRTRTERPEFRSGRHRVRVLSSDKVFGYHYEHGNGDLIALHNFSADQQRIPVTDLPSPPLRSVLPNGRGHHEFGEAVELAAFGFDWIQLQ